MVFEKGYRPWNYKMKGQGKGYKQSKEHIKNRIESMISHKIIRLRPKTIIKNCKKCNIEFKSFKSDNKKYCSQKCYWLFLKGCISHRKNMNMIEEYGEKKAKDIKNQIKNTLKRKYKLGELINSMLGKKMSTIAIEKIKNKKTGIPNQKHSKFMFNSWQNKKYKEKQIRSILQGMLKRPTSFEKIIIDIINKYKLPYKYTGDGSFLIGYKNPDFINCNGEKICIEVYNDFHHPNNYEEIRSKHFSDYGWKTIFIDEREIRDENIILGKIK